MKKLKAVVCTILSMAMIATNVVSVSAENSEPYDWDALSLQTGLGVSELQEAYELSTQQEFDDAIQVYTEATVANQANRIATRAAAVIGDGAWRYFRDSLSNGSILVTQDNKTAGFRHGHASIISGMSNTSASDPLNWTIYFTEHPGKDSNNGLSWRYLLGNQNTLWWRQRTTLASFNYKPGSTVLYDAMNDAGNEACSARILNKPYNTLGAKTNTAAYNCSSLVWRCYVNALSVDLAADVSYVLPVNLAKSNKLNRAYNYGTWVSW